MKVIDNLVVELGVETTWGTAVAPTTKVAAITEISMQPGVETADFQSLEGLGPRYQTAIVATMGEGSASGYLDYQFLHVWLSSLMKTVSPTGAGPYVWTFSPTLTAQPTRKFFTIAYGDTTEAYSLVGALVNSMTISGASKEAVTIDMDFLGMQVEADALAGASVDNAAVIATAADSTFSMDDMNTSTPAHGTTSIGCDAFSFELELNSNTALVMGLGSVNPCEYFSRRWEGTLSVTMEFPGTGNVTKTLLANHLGASPSQVRKDMEINITDGTYICQIQFTGEMMSTPEIFSDRDGVTTLELEFAGFINSGWNSGNFVEIAVTNDASALPA